MNDEQLHNELQSRIPEPSNTYWDSIDSRLVAIENADDFDHPADATGSLVDDELGDDRVVQLPDASRRSGKAAAVTQGSRFRYLAVAAAIFAVLGIGAVVLNQRADRDTAGELNVATQPDTSGTPDGSDETAPDPGDNPDSDRTDLLPDEEAMIDETLECFQSQAAWILDQADAQPFASDWHRLAILQFDQTGQGTLATWEDIPWGEDELPTLLSATVSTGSEELLTFQEWTAEGTTAEGGTYTVIQGNRSLTIGNILMDAVPCEQIQPAIDLVFGAVPGLSDPVIEVVPQQTIPSATGADLTPQAPPGSPGGVPEAPLEAMQNRLDNPNTDFGPAGPFCFSSERAFLILRPDNPDEFDQQTIAAATIGADGSVDLVIRQSNEVSASFAAVVPGSADGVFDIDLAIINAEGANFQSPPIPHRVVLTNESLTVSNSEFPASECTGFEADFERIRTQSAERDAFLIENPVSPIWRFIDGPINFRAAPGLDGEIIGSWVGTERGVPGTGQQVIADGFTWVELEPVGDRPGGWVARDFVVLDTEDDDPAE